MKALPSLLAILSFIACAHAQSTPRDSVLDVEVDLGGARSAGTKVYRFSTDYLAYSPDGKLASKENALTKFDLAVDEAGVQTLTVREFALVDADGVRKTIPGLVGWQNIMDPDSDELLGIPHADFVGLMNDAGQPLAPEIAHRVYNTFVDFYAFNNVFGRPTDAEGNDIGDLTSIGQVIEHYSAYSRPPVSLGDVVGEGSYFQNGRVTLEWKGMSRIGARSCALVGFDSGESEFHMAMTPAPGMDLTVNGGSQYWGDLYIDSESLWLERGTFIEVVISRIQFGDNLPMDSVIKRIGTIELVE